MNNSQQGFTYLQDLKADNILVETSGICKISDFGIAKRTDDINENGEHTSMQGSIFWMAPEVVQAARKGEQHGYNGKVDIWSLGCVVLEMWAGRRPWQDIDAIAVIYEVRVNICSVSPYNNCPLVVNNNERCTACSC